MSAAELLALMQALLALEPAAVSAVQSFVTGLQGKSDAEVLAMDATTIAGIIKNAGG